MTPASSRGFARTLMVIGALSGFSCLSACRATEPSSKPVDACRASCEKKAKSHCSDDQCERGCEFILDRLVEREGEHVIACVASGPRRCTDVVWADCATKVGVHADGGPPAPAAASDDE